MSCHQYFSSYHIIHNLLLVSFAILQVLPLMHSHRFLYMKSLCVWFFFPNNNKTHIANNVERKLKTPNQSFLLFKSKRICQSVILRLEWKWIRLCKNFVRLYIWNAFYFFIEWMVLIVIFVLYCRHRHRHRHRNLMKNHTIWIWPVIFINRV